MRAFAVVAGTLLTALPAQLYTTDAGVLSPALVALRERFEWRHRGAADEWVATTMFAFSPSRAVELDVAVPVLARRVDGAVAGTQEGLGDVHVTSKWALVRDDDVMRSDRLSLLFDVHLPTGDDDGVVDGVDLGPRAGLGLGTFGVTAGLGGTIVRDRHRAAIALRWWEFATHDGFAPGSAVTVDAAWWYRLTPAVFAPDRDELELRLTTELLFRHADEDRLAGTGLGNDGDDLVLVVGLQAHPSPALALEVGVRVPLVGTIDGPFGDERIGALCSCRILF